MLRFGQFARVLQPGPHFKAPWPIERVTKVNATQSKTFSDNVPVLTRDENIVSVEINVQYRIGDPQHVPVRHRATPTRCCSRPRRARCASRSAVPTSTPCSARAARWPCSAREQPAGLARGLPHRPGRDRAQPAQRASAGRGQAGLRRRQQRPAGQGPPDQRGPGLRRARSCPKRAARPRACAPRPRVTRPPSIARAEGDADRFSLLVDQYKAAPEVTRKRLWLETVQEVLADNRKIVGGDSRQLIYVPMAATGAAARPRRRAAADARRCCAADGHRPTTDARAGRAPTRPTGREEATR